ncbi:MAG: glycosyltransferase [Planctomycetota bacterium]|nr:glycosyltransferase [Planctomycetota bacterium]
MRILLVSHNVPPHGSAGTETYTAELSRALARRGHAVAVFAAQKDIRRKDGRVLVRHEDGVAIHEIVNNLYHARFRETWDNPRVERAFAELLRAHRPDVVHVQHLMYLSAGCVGIAKDFGARVVFTLHDYWLTCARLGQRVHQDGGLCHTVDFARCGTCLVDHPWTQPWAARAVGPVIAALHETTGFDLGDTARRARLYFAPKAAAPAFSTETARGSVPVPEAPTLAGASKSGAIPDEGATPSGAAGTEGRELPATRPDLPERSAIRDPADPSALELATQATARWRDLRERVGTRVDLFLAPSRFLRDRFVAEWGIEPERIEHLRFGFDPARFSGARTPAPDGRVRIGFLGTLVPLKGPHVLLEAWRRIPAATRERGRLVLCGPARYGPAYQEHLLDLARSGGAEIPGPLGRDEIAPFLLATDLLVVPSLWFENSPLAIQEAIACRTPLLVSDLGGMAELVVPGENGLRFPAGDVVALAAILTRVLERSAGLERLYAESARLPSFDEHVDAVLARYARKDAGP